MALKDEIFKKHLNLTKKISNKTYNHFRPFDDPDYQKKLLEHEKNIPLTQKENHHTIYYSNNTQLDHPSEEFNIFNPNNYSNTNLTQTTHKTDTNLTQTTHKPDTNLTQTTHKLHTKPDTNLTQTTPKKPNLHTIVGIQRKLLFYIFNLCKMNGTKITAPLHCEVIHENTFVEKNSIKTSLNRLIKKGFLIKEEIKNGRSGWVVFRLPDLIYQELFNNDLSLNLTQTTHKPNTEPNTNLTVCSSYINNTTNIPENFKQIDYFPLNDFGFDESHIIQIYREYTKNPELALSTEMIQNSINALAYDLKHNDVAANFKNSPTVVLTAMLKKGQPYSSKTPNKFLSPREEAVQEYLAAQEKRRQTVQELENRAKEVMLQEWLRSLSEAEMENFAPQDPCPVGMPEKVYQTSCRKKALAAAQEYFITVIWPKKLDEFEVHNKPAKPEA